MKDKKFLMKNLILGLLVILLIVFPLVTIKNAEFAGADDRATQAIAEVDKNYKPWFEPIWEPPSGEIESLLFALQAAIGAGFLGYYIGVAKWRKNVNR
ncbi:MAG: Cobalt transport protein CbiN [Caldanaerobacter subterraneus]|jgi:cobalt/nickel transport protein|uniref:Cobalt transport protein CbiN n=2 Tax=Thermoanaerobacter TaxID=1754 RepID=B0KCR1_THEP3|nr:MULTISPECIES: energy-coupling factor ABC transporter substrate-binding protein [Thermoanaerobacter]KUJ90209.1 MAG: cobalt transport protein [Thermoanaerobacter thermocopriae]KUK34791.1 MAG: Cobalt transport protein CbiN [Caldanaerobacter subterraneus]ABY91640.1 cobalt transport protein [Thermoanaerobacter sp. X514]ABY95518.1 cobalt transport protein [Thermoanaerobacter pseudethanolicus ATCC 33223]ADV80457.1 cobalt transport protein [Thermoanaerobacter brockii subsp. finnii Ako-1]